MLFIFLTLVLIRHLWQLKTVIFLHRCLKRLPYLTRLLITKDEVRTPHHLPLMFLLFGYTEYLLPNVIVPLQTLVHFSKTGVLAFVIF